MELSILGYAREIKDNIDYDAVRPAIEAISQGERDFTTDEYRFIHTLDIDDILAEELASDEYILGCFNAWFIADVIGVDTDVIEAMQAAEAFEAIGKLIISLDKVEELASAYAAADGYGHHFNSWDGSETEIGDYLVFRT